MRMRRCVVTFVVLCALASAVHAERDEALAAAVAAGAPRPDAEPEVFGLVGKRASAMFPQCEQQGIHVCRFVVKHNKIHLSTMTVAFEAHDAELVFVDGFDAGNRLHFFQHSRDPAQCHTFATYSGRHNDLSYVHGSVKGKTRTEAMMMIKHGRFQGVEHKVVGQVAYRGTGATPRVTARFLLIAPSAVTWTVQVECSPDHADNAAAIPDSWFHLKRDTEEPEKHVPAPVKPTDPVPMPPHLLEERDGFDEASARLARDAERAFRRRIKLPSQPDAEVDPDTVVNQKLSKEAPPSARASTESSSSNVLVFFLGIGVACAMFVAMRLLRIGKRRD